MLGSTIESYDGAPLLEVEGDLGKPISVMYVELILVVLNEFTDAPGIGSNVGFIFGSTDGEVLGYNIEVPDVSMVGIDEGGRMIFLVAHLIIQMMVSLRVHCLVNH